LLIFDIIEKVTNFGESINMARMRLLRIAEEDILITSNSYQFEGKNDDEFSAYDEHEHGFTLNLECSYILNLKKSWPQLKKMFSRRLDSLRFLYKHFYVSSRSAKISKLRTLRVYTSRLEEIFEDQEEYIFGTIDKSYDHESVIPKEGYTVINFKTNGKELLGITLNITESNSEVPINLMNSLGNKIYKSWPKKLLTKIDKRVIDGLSSIITKLEDEPVPPISKSKRLKRKGKKFTFEKKIFHLTSSTLWTTTDETETETEIKTEPKLQKSSNTCKKLVDGKNVIASNNRWTTLSMLQMIESLKFVL
jgi:hypothetical protein